LDRGRGLLDSAGRPPGANFYYSPFRLKSYSILTTFHQLNVSKTVGLLWHIKAINSNNFTFRLSLSFSP
jgi:hypothetical protein